jgi:hypothetical protein
MPKSKHSSKREPLTCVLTDDDYNRITLELAHIDALAQVANERADENDGPAKTSLMLLSERLGIIENLLSAAWDKSREARHG